MRTVVGVMGSGEGLDSGALDVARTLGRLIAERGWVLLNGGRACGAMDASALGAHEAGGLVVGVLPDADSSRASAHLDIAIRTGMGDARNAVNVLSSDVVIVLPGGAGTISEAALALKARKPVIALGFDLGAAFARYVGAGLLHRAETPAEAVGMAEGILERGGA